MIEVSANTKEALHRLSLRYGFRISDIIDMALVGWEIRMEAMNIPDHSIKEIIIARWQEFIDSTSPILQFALNTVEPEIEGNKLIINTGLNFTHDQLQQHMPALKKAFGSFYGMDIEIEVRVVVQYG